MDRRRFLVGTAVLALLPFDRAAATPDSMAEAIRKIVGDAVVREERVKLDLPPLIENGNTVPLVVSVESPMSVGDHVRAIHVFNEKNPQPNVVSCPLGPRAGLANVSTRIRLNDTQTVIARFSTWPEAFPLDTLLSRFKPLDPQDLRAMKLQRMDTLKTEAEKIAAGEERGNGLRLDGGRPRIVRRGKSAQQRLGEAERVERNRVSHWVSFMSASRSRMRR